MDDFRTAPAVRPGRVDCSPLAAALVSRAHQELQAGDRVAADGRFRAAITVDVTPAARYAYAGSLAERGDAAAAIVQLEAAWELARQVQSPTWRARCCHALADLHRGLGRRDLADRYRQWGVRADLDAGDDLPATGWFQDRFDDALLAGELDAAANWRAALERLTAAAEPAAGSIPYHRGVLLFQQGRWSAALRCFVQAYQQFRREQNWHGCARAVLNVGHVLQSRCAWRRAQTCFEHAARLAGRFSLQHLRRQADDCARECRRFEAARHGDPGRN